MFPCHKFSFMQALYNYYIFYQQRGIVDDNCKTFKRLSNGCF